MALTRDDVRKIAHLARLELTESEIERYRQQLSQVLDYVARLEELDVAGVEPTVQAVARSNVMRADEPRPSLEPETVLANAAATAEQQFFIQRVLDDA